jgi:hypothetical protein
MPSSSTGGWVQPDEANTNFDILVNQLTEGHDYLLKNFGVRPRFAWQVRLPPSTVLGQFSQFFRFVPGTQTHTMAGLVSIQFVADRPIRSFLADAHPRCGSRV